MENVKTYRALLIDPEERTVRVIQIENNIFDWYKQASCDVIQFCNVTLKSGSCTIKYPLLLDQEGLLKQCNNYFTFKGQVEEYQRFAGKAIMMNITLYKGKMKNMPKRVTPKKLLDIIKWLD